MEQLSYSQVKRESKDKVEAARKKYLDKVIATNEFKTLKDKIDVFLNNPYDESNSFYFDEFGTLRASIDIYLPDILCLDDAGEIDHEIIKEVLDELSDVCYFESTDYAQGPREYQCSQCLGEPTIFNSGPQQKYYSIYSSELGLTINKVESEELGFALIEQAMRKCGIFGDIVSTDYYDNFICFKSVPKDIRDLSDSDLQDLICKLKTKE